MPKSALWCRYAHFSLQLFAFCLTVVEPQGLTEKMVRDPQDIMRLMEEGSAQRATGSTGANEWSSRSHAVMQVSFLISVLVSACVWAASSNIVCHLQLILTERGATKVHGKISFIDLAGSERGADTYSSRNPDTLSFCDRNFDFQLPQ